jgi:hypothetical protein
VSSEPLGSSCEPLGWRTGTEAITLAKIAAKIAAEKASQDDETGRSEGEESAEEASKLIRKAADLMDDAENVLKRTSEGGRYVNVTVIEGVKEQAATIKRKREEVETLLNRTLGQ